MVAMKVDLKVAQWAEKWVASMVVKRVRG